MTAPIYGVLRTN